MPALDRYQEIRAEQRSLNSKLLQALPKSTKGNNYIVRAARDLGYRVRDAVIVFPGEEAMDRLSDYMIYERLWNGKSTAERFRESNPDLTSLEHEILQATIASETSLYEITELDKTAHRALVIDLLQDRPPFWLTDAGMSATFRRGTLLFARMLSVEGYTMASGAGIAFGPNDKPFLLDKVKKLDRIKNAALRSRKRFALFVDLEKYSKVRLVYA
jgi:hypothetical protein